MFEKPFGQTNEQKKRAEEILAGSGLGLEKKEDDNKGQFLGVKVSKDTNSVDNAFGIIKENKNIIEGKLKNIRVGMEEEYDKHSGNVLEAQNYSKAVEITPTGKKIIEKKLKGSELDGATIEDIDN